MEARRIMWAIGLIFFIGGLVVLPVEKGLALWLMVVSSGSFVAEKAMGLKIRRPKRNFHIVNLRDGTEYRG